jgi:hypothetical protein
MARSASPVTLDDPATGLALVHAPQPFDPAPLLALAALDGARTAAEAEGRLEGAALRCREALGPDHLRLELPGGAAVRALRCDPVAPSLLDRRPAVVRLEARAHRLRALGVAALRPVGHLVARAAPARAPGWLLLEDRDGAGAHAVLGPLAAAPARRAALEATGALLAALGRAGLVPVAPEALAFVEGEGAVVVDPRALAGFRRLDARAMAPLAAAADRLALRRADRLRALRAWLRHDHDPRGAVRAAWRVARG